MSSAGIHNPGSVVGETPSVIDPVSGAGGSGVGYLADPDGVLEATIQRVAAHDGDLTFFVGAGVSMEAGLPSWPHLVSRLLDAVGDDLPPGERQEWVDRTLEEGPLAAAAIARALHPAEADFRRSLRLALYDRKRPADYVPGALADQLAWLKTEFGSRMRLVTANFDGLLEAALVENGLTPVSYVRARTEPKGKAAVWHLHGRLMQARKGDWLREGQLVLAEGDYVQSTYATWPQEFVAERLRDSLCVFVGLSMTDPNFVRWLYRHGGAAGHEHVAVFVRQGAPETTAAVRAKLEAAAQARWARSGIRPVWTNYYGEVAQLVHEIGLRRIAPDEPRFRARAARLHEIAGRYLMPRGTAEFVEAQLDASTWLRDRVEDIRRIAAAHDVDLDGQDLGLGLWVADHENGTAELWATSHRALLDRESIEARPLVVGTPWIGVEAITRGVPLDDDPAVYTSRWRFVRGVPIIVAPRGPRSVVGALTLTSTTPRDSSDLSVRRAPAGLLPEIDRLLVRSAAEFFEP